jgi:hypothetical protein
MSLTHIPAGRSAAGLGESAKMLRAKKAKSKVLNTAKVVQAFDQQDGVDLNKEANKVSVKDASAPMNTTDMMFLMSGNPMAAITEKITGEASFGADGEATSADLSVQESIGKAQQVRFQQTEDGAKVYSAPDLMGYVTVREHQDGTLFIATGSDPAQDFQNLTSSEFQAPETAPSEGPQKEGLWRMVPASVADVDIEETSEKVVSAIDSGAKKLGGWLSKLTKTAEKAASDLLNS